jgi:hypothetical protein
MFWLKALYVAAQLCMHGYVQGCPLHIVFNFFSSFHALQKVKKLVRGEQRHCC